MKKSKKPWGNRARYFMKLVFTDYAKGKEVEMLRATLYRMYIAIAIQILTFMVLVFVIIKILQSKHLL